MSSKSLIERSQREWLEIVAILHALYFVYLVTFEPIDMGTIVLGLFIISLFIYTSVRRLKRKEGESDGE